MKEDIVANARTITRIAALACAASVAVAPLAPAQAQLPGGLDPAQVRNMIPSEVSVRAGETTTVDVGVPVNVSYSANGWQVTSSGTTVSVTAPNQPGSTAAVPASAYGYTATITLVAVGGGEDVAPDSQEHLRDDATVNPTQAPSQEQPGDGGGAAPGTESGAGNGAGAGAGAGAGSGAAAVTHPPREKAAPVATSGAKRLAFDGVIEGNQLVVKVPLSRAGELMQYANVSRDGAKLRYLDINGRIIQGVKRDVDIAARTLTLTYPEGETPDNPFIMEVVRDDSAAEFIAVITATNAAVETPEGAGAEGADATDGAEENPYANVAKEAAEESGSSRSLAPLAIGGVALLVMLALLGTWLARRGRGRA